MIRRGRIKKHCSYENCRDALICHTNNLAFRNALRIEYRTLCPAIVIEKVLRR